MYRLSFAAIALGVTLSGFGFPSRASAAEMSIVSQSGTLSVNGRTITLGSMSESIPIVSLANFNEMVSVEDVVLA